MTSLLSENRHARLRKRQTSPNLNPSILPLSPPSPSSTTTTTAAPTNSAVTVRRTPPHSTLSTRANPQRAQRASLVRPSTAASPGKKASRQTSWSTCTRPGQRGVTARPSTAASKVACSADSARGSRPVRRGCVRCHSATSPVTSPHQPTLLARRASSAVSLTVSVTRPDPDPRVRAIPRRRSAGSGGSCSGCFDPHHRPRRLSSPTSPLSPAGGDPAHKSASPWLASPHTPRSLHRGGSSRSLRFSPEGGRSPTTRSPLPGRKDCRRLFYNAALMALHSRRIAGGGQRARRESSGSQGRRSSSHAQGGARKSSADRLAQLTSVVSFVALQHRVRLRMIRKLWAKVRLWSRIIGILAAMLRHHAAAAMEDPSSPFYSHTPGRLVPDLVVPEVDRDHYMFFDPALFKANRQRRVSQEVQRILTKPPEQRSPEEIQHVMIGLRDIPQLAVYPVRMQRNLAQFGQFQCLEAKRMVLKQGHRPEGFYFILYGNVAVAVKNEETGFVNIVVELPRGESFGELSIVSGGARNSSVLTTTYTELLAISKPVYETIFAGGIKNFSDPEQTAFFSSLSFLRGWPVEKMWDKQFQRYVRLMYIQRNGVIMRDSNHNNWLVVVKSGSVTVLKKLVHSRPTVCRRTGQYRDPSSSPLSPSSAFFSFLTHDSDYRRWLLFHSLTLPPPLQLAPSDGEGGEGQDVGGEVQEECEHEGWETEDDENDREGDERDDDDEEKAGGEEGARRRRRVRPQTCSEGHPHPLPSRRAWSATHPHTSPPLDRTPRQKRAKIQFEGAGETPPPDRKEQEARRVSRFVSAKRTLLDDLDASYLATDHQVTEADRNPQFVYVQTLTKGDVFGLAPLVFRDQPSLCLVSNGAECLMMDRQFYLDHCPPDLARRLKIEVSPYPSEAKLQQDLLTRVNWQVYKQAVKHQVWQQSSSHVTTRPSSRGQ